MKTVHRFGPPPTALRRTRLDNLALVPGSVLPYIARCHEVANQLPQNGVLVVLPKDQPLQRKALLAVAKLLAAEGHQVRVVPADEMQRGQRMSRQRSSSNPTRCRYRTDEPRPRIEVRGKLVSASLL